MWFDVLLPWTKSCHPLGHCHFTVSSKDAVYIFAKGIMKRFIVNKVTTSNFIGHWEIELCEFEEASSIKSLSTINFVEHLGHVSHQFSLAFFSAHLCFSKLGKFSLCSFDLIFRCSFNGPFSRVEHSLGLSD